MQHAAYVAAVVVVFALARSLTRLSNRLLRLLLPISDVLSCLFRLPACLRLAYSFSSHFSHLTLVECQYDIRFAAFYSSHLRLLLLTSFLLLLLLLLLLVFFACALQ